jgi:hypothetical protein
MRGRAAPSARLSGALNWTRPIGEFARRTRKLFPGYPSGRERVIAEHACLKYSGRVGRSEAAKAYDEDAVRLAVVAHVRHVETPYDRLLASGLDRVEARRRVEAGRVAPARSAMRRR